MNVITRKTLKAALSACLALNGAVQGHAAYVYVDTFASNQTVNLAGGAPGSAFGYTNATGAALGNERDILVTRTNLPVGGAIVAQVIESASNGVLSYSANPGALGSAAVVYDSLDGSSGIDFAGLSSFDLTGGGINDQFWIRGGADNSGGLFRIAVYSSSNNYSFQTLVIPSGTGTESTFTNFFFSFLGMSDVGAGADFSNVNAIVLELDGLAQAGIDMGLNLFVAIPEPIGWWPLAGLVGIALLRRHLGRKSRV